ncbi:putative 3-oxo-5-alpha-steroid 4-dehydrogenase/very-long-chain enoyl-CoA reductase [Helianthus debilis subsp. tardiflorus]
MAIPSIFLNFLFPPPPSLFVTTMSVIGISSFANAGYMEIKGKHMQYSKFLNEGVAKKENGAKLSSRNGMLLAYTPAFVVGLSSLLAFPDQDLRFLLLASSLTVHFLKRVVEVLFLHKYSGSMGLESAIIITLSYTVTCKNGDQECEREIEEKESKEEESLKIIRY